MSLNDPLANALSKINQYEQLGKKELIVKPASKLIAEVLGVIRDARLLGEITLIEDGRGNMFKVNLLSAINKCNAIKPRFPVSMETYTRFEKRYLPSVHMGILIVSTSQGVMSHHAAKKKAIGGKLLAYCY
ncbi:MAG: 30S ribosomal protein S8 [archaeon]